MRALLIGNGETQEAAFLQPLAQQADLILAADGGADRALSAGGRPDVIIGDLDSVSPQAKKILPAEKFIFVNNQNNTDLEKALDYLIAHQCTQCTLTGFVGGRWDFTFGNFLSVYPYLDKMDICVAGKGWKIWPLTHSVTKTVRPGARVSQSQVIAVHTNLESVSSLAATRVNQVVKTQMVIAVFGKSHLNSLL